MITSLPCIVGSFLRPTLKKGVVPTSKSLQFSSCLYQPHSPTDNFSQNFSHMKIYRGASVKVRCIRLFRRYLYLALRGEKLMNFPATVEPFPFTFMTLQRNKYC